MQDQKYDFLKKDKSSSRLLRHCNRQVALQLLIGGSPHSEAQLLLKDGVVWRHYTPGPISHAVTHLGQPHTAAVIHIEKGSTLPLHYLEQNLEDSNYCCHILAWSHDQPLSL